MRLHPRDAARRVPAHASRTLQESALQFEEGRDDSCALQLRLPASDFRRTRSTRPQSLSLVFAFDREGTLTIGSRKGDKPALVIFTFEAIAVKTFHGKGQREHTSKVQMMPTWTDNHGNRSAENKITTRNPASAVIMYVSFFMERRRLKVLVEWIPRNRTR